MAAPSLTGEAESKPPSSNSENAQVTPSACQNCVRGFSSEIVGNELSAGMVFEGSGGRQIELKNRLGQGTSAEVWEVSWGGQRAAAKILHARGKLRKKHQELDDMQFEAMHQALLGGLGTEASLGQTLRGLALACHDTFLTAEGPGIVIELVEGQRINDALRGASLEEQLRVLLLLLAQIEQTHQSGWVHCDLKPDNIFCTDQGIKILDWGGAVAADPVTRASTMLGRQFSGTPGYAAPEFFDDPARIGAHSDLWSFSVIALEILTGYPLREMVRGRSQEERKYIGCELLDMARNTLTQPEIQPLLEAFAQALSDKSLPLSAASLRVVVEETLGIDHQGSTEFAPPPPVPPKARKGRASEQAWGLWVVAALVLSMVAIAASRLAQKGPEPREPHSAPEESPSTSSPPRAPAPPQPIPAPAPRPTPAPTHPSIPAPTATTKTSLPPQAQAPTEPRAESTAPSTQGNGGACTVSAEEEKRIAGEVDHEAVRSSAKTQQKRLILLGDDLVRKGDSR